jgi:PAS domain S-box-containing protein
MRISEIIGKKDEDLFPEEIAEETANDDRHVIETGIPLVNKEEGGKSIGEGEHWVLTTKLPWRDKKGNIIGLFGISKEITDRKRAEEALRESEEKFRTVSEQSPNMIFINKGGKVVYANKVCEEIMGYKRDEFYSPDFDFLRLIESESVDSVRSAFKRHMDGKEVEPYEYTLVNKEGKRIEAIITTRLMNYEGERAILGIVTDISERKRVEKALRESEARLRSLSVQLMKAQEMERMRLSKELHDELGQALALLKHQVRSVKSKLQKGQSSLREECEETGRYIDEIIENVRRLSRDLSPSILEDLGLTSALRWLTENFEKQYSLVGSFDIDNMDDLFSKEAQTNLYRISQEALNNIAKHAEAKQVSFTVKEKEGSVALIIEDDGKGFDVNRIRAMHFPEKGLGFDTMGERAHMLGASLKMKSQAGEGTRITLTVPIRKVGKE